MNNKKNNLFKMAEFINKIENTSCNKIQQDKYRFSGERYSLQGGSNYGPSDIIPQVSGLYNFPRGEERYEFDDCSSYSFVSSITNSSLSNSSLSESSFSSSSNSSNSSYSSSYSSSSSSSTSSHSSSSMSSSSSSNAGCPDGYVRVDLLTNLSAHFKLNDNSSNTIVVDTGPNLHNAVSSVNTSILSTSGKINNAFNFTGIEYVTLGNYSYYKPNTFISLWVKRTYAGDTTTRSILSKYGGALYGWDGWSLSLNNTTITLWINGNIQDNYFNGSIVDDTNWHHIYVELRRGGNCRVYVDNVLKINATDGNTSYNENVNLIMGSGLIGKIDDVRFYTAALTPQKILALYNYGNGTEEVTYCYEEVIITSSSSSSSLSSLSSLSSESSSSSSGDICYKAHEDENIKIYENYDVAIYEDCDFYYSSDSSDSTI